MIWKIIFTSFGQLEESKGGVFKWLFYAAIFGIKKGVTIFIATPFLL